MDPVSILEFQGEETSSVLLSTLLRNAQQSDERLQLTSLGLRLLGIAG